MTAEYITEITGGVTVIRLNAHATEALVSSIITSSQGKRVLMDAGLYDAAMGAINALAEPARTTALIDWDAPTWRRDNPTVLLLANALGLDPAAMDVLFAKASAQ